jgi:NAD+ kinase
MGGLDMKFTIVSKGDEKSNSLYDKLKSYLTDFKLEYDEKEPDIVVSVGGDGTLLTAFQRYRHRLNHTAFVGIHTGHLGFYADWMPEEIEKLVIAIAKTECRIVEYPLLEVIIFYNQGKKEDHYLALNEATIKSVEGTFVIDVEIKDELFERFRGDGLCVSTPSGSTAYNKALGGAIIHPSLESIQISEIASINNRIFRTIGSPLVLPAHHKCIFRPVTHKDFLIGIDHLSFIQKDIRALQFKVADQKIRFARFKPFPFWSRVRTSFIGDLNVDGTYDVER